MPSYINLVIRLTKEPEREEERFSPYTSLYVKEMSHLGPNNICNFSHLLVLLAKSSGIGVGEKCTKNSKKRKMCLLYIVYNFVEYLFY